MAISYKPMVKPLPGSRSQAPMRNMDFRPGDEQGVQAQTLPGNPMQPMRAGDIQMLAGGGGGIGGFLNSQFTPPGAAQMQSPMAQPQTDPFQAPRPSSGSPLIQGPMQPPGYQMPLQSSLQQGEHAVALNPNPSPVSVHDREVQLMNAMRQRQAAQGQQPAPAAQQGMYSPPPATSGRPAFDSNASVYGRPQIGGGFVYAPDLRNQQLSPQDQQQVDRYRQWQQADPAGPYSNAAGLNRFQSLQTHQSNTMRPPTSDWKLGQGDEQYAKNRRASGRVTAYVGGAAGQARSLTPEQITANRDRARGREESLKTGRRDRAIAKYGLDHLTPSNGTNAKAPVTGNGPSVSPDASLAERQAAATRSAQHPVFADAAKDNYDPNTASLQQSWDFFSKKKGNWSADDISAFGKALEDRAIADKDGFGKEWDAFKNQTEWKGDPSLRDNEVFKRVNEFRVALGLKPLVYVDEPIPKPNPIPSGPPGMLTPGFGMVR